MSSHQFNERKSNRPLSHIPLQARQLLRDNAQRAANWFRKPSFSRFKLKFSSPSSRSSPYSHSSSTEGASIQTSSSATVYSITSNRPRASQTTPTHNTRRLVRTSPVIVPIMPTVGLLLFTSPRGWPICFVFSSGSSPISSSPYQRQHRSWDCSCTLYFIHNYFEKSVLDL